MAFGHPDRINAKCTVADCALPPLRRDVRHIRIAHVLAGLAKAMKGHARARLFLIGAASRQRIVLLRLNRGYLETDSDG